MKFLVGLLLAFSCSLAIAEKPAKPKSASEENMDKAAITEQEWEEKYQQLIKKRADIRKKVESGNATKEDVISWMKSGGDKKKETGGKAYYGWNVEVKDPAAFRKLQQQSIFSGPQSGEKLAAFTAIGLTHRKGEEFDPVATNAGKPQVLIFQDQSEVAVKGLYLFGPVLEKISNKSKTGLTATVVFLADDPSDIDEEKFAYLRKATDAYRFCYSTDGRDGPGPYGLDRNVSMTILIAKDGEVLHNFAFATPMLYPDPHVVGALAEAVGEERDTIEAWLKDGKKSYGKPAAKKGLRGKLAEFVKAGKITRKEAEEIYKVAIPSN